MGASPIAVAFQIIAVFHFHQYDGYPNIYMVLAPSQVVAFGISEPSTVLATSINGDLYVSLKRCDSTRHLSFDDKKLATHQLRTLRKDGLLVDLRLNGWRQGGRMEVVVVGVVVVVGGVVLVVVGSWEGGLFILMVLVVLGLEN